MCVLVFVTTLFLVISLARLNSTSDASWLRGVIA